MVGGWDEDLGIWGGRVPDAPPVMRMILFLRGKSMGSMMMMMMMMTYAEGLTLELELS